jgi:hypothetical protein
VIGRQSVGQEPTPLKASERSIRVRNSTASKQEPAEEPKMKRLPTTIEVK